MSSESREILPIQEILAKYEGEWVLIGDPVLDKSSAVIGGTVLFHDRDRDVVHQRTMELRPGFSATKFAGSLFD